jgi:hypothetical protein
MHEGVAPIYITSLARFVVSSPAFGSSYLLPLLLSVLSYLQSFVLPAAVLVGVIADSLLYTTYQVTPLLRLENHPVHQIDNTNASSPPPPPPDMHQRCVPIGLLMAPHDTVEAAVDDILCMLPR